MKITCTKRDDILKRKQEYEADRSKRQARYDAQYKQFSDQDRYRQETIENGTVFSNLSDWVRGSKEKVNFNKIKSQFLHTSN